MTRVLCRLCVIVALVAAATPPLAAQSNPKAAMLEQAGWEALSAGNAAAAADAFQQAIASDPKNARGHVGAGMAAFQQRRFDDARTHAQNALALDTSLMSAHALLGQALRRTGDLAGAIREFEIVVRERPDDAVARDTLARWRREADLHGRMQVAVGESFTVSFEGPEESAIADEALAALDRAYWRIGDVLGTYPPASIRVVLYSREQFRDITRSPPWAGGVFDGTIRVPVRGALQNVKEFERTLAHEFVHAFVHALAPRGVPAWLNEGLATALESESIAWAEQHARASSAIVPLSALEQPFGRFSDEPAQMAYAISAIAAHRLLQDAGGAAVTNLLRDIGQGVSFETAFLHRVQLPLAEFEKRLRGQ